MARGLQALEVFVGALLGAAIWALSPRLTGKVEPWDAPNMYYPGALFIAGLLAAAVYPRRFWLAPIGVYIGQFAYAFAFLPIGGLFPLGLVFGAACALVSLAGAALTYGLHALVKRRNRPG